MEVAVISPALLEEMTVPLASMGVTGLIVASLLWFKREKVPKKVSEKVVDIKSPFSLWPALKFGLFFVAISLLASIAKDIWGSEGLYATSLLSGILDVDAITVHLSNEFNAGNVAMQSAVNGITIAAMTNTFVKGAIFLMFANKKAGWRVALTMLAAIAVGAATLFVF